MTREKAIKLIGGMKSDLSDFYDYDDLTALDMAISALSAEGEYIKKEDALNICHRACDGDMDIDEWIEREINKLPTYSFPDREKGEWIPMFDRWGDIVTAVCGYECSKCGEWNADNDKFCPNCGVDMRGE